VDGQGGNSNAIDYSSYTTTVRVNLSTVNVLGIEPFSATGIASLSNIQDILGGSANDILIGGADDNVITGNGGNDLLLGDAGDDVYKFANGWGADLITEIAGEGNDTFDFSAASVNLTFTIGSVLVTDAFGNGIAGQAVTWAVTAGGGTLTGATNVNTDANGYANAPAWTLGRRGGAQGLTATANALQFSFTATIQSNFAVTLRWSGTPPSAAIQQAFTDAVNRISAMVTGDITDQMIQALSGNGPFNVADCGNASVTGTVQEVVDDVIIFAAVVPIDGVGNVLGSAGPCLTRVTGGLTALGTMRFDSADLDNLRKFVRFVLAGNSAEIGTLIAIFGVNAAMNLFGWSMELANESRTKVQWSHYAFGCVAGVVPWIVIFVALWTAAGPGAAGPRGAHAERKRPPRGRGAV